MPKKSYIPLEWPVRTLSFSHDGKMLASASEDLIIDIAEVDSVSLMEAVYLEYARLLANLGLRAPAEFYCQKASDKGRQLKEEAKTMSSAEIVSSAINFKPTKHQCPVCGKTYGGNTKLNYHMATHGHTGIRPHKCSICGKAFTQKSTLRTHFRIHTGEKPYKCRTCTRAFGDYFTSMKHERTHSGEKPYACPECGKNTEHCLQFTVISRTNYREFSQSALPLRCHSVSLVADDTSNPVVRKLRGHI
uniref:C2H2-type domain-containing protein n=1 Tax=Magallana gigas TaxID=29159 RepID=K1RDJ4_MAGGI